jgi:predicted transposase YbfD/YdcC
MSSSFDGHPRIRSGDMATSKRTVFITFGENIAGGYQFGDAAERLELQAKSSSFFDGVLNFDAQSLSKLPNFTQIEKLFSQEYWGFGYFIWKPFIIDWALNTLSSEYDYVVYADAGCEIADNYSSRSTFEKTLTLLNQQPVLAFWNEQPEIGATKKNVLNILADPEDHYRGQIEATVIYFKIEEKSKEFSTSWLNSCIDNHFEAILPEIDSTTGKIDLSLHRYDQSLFSVLYKNEFNIALNPIRPRVNREGAPKRFDLFIHIFNPILPLRNRSSKEFVNQQNRYSVIVYAAKTLFVVFRVIRSLKRRIDPRAKNNSNLRLLKRYQNLGWYSTK